MEFCFFKKKNFKFYKFSSWHIQIPQWKWNISISQASLSFQLVVFLSEVLLAKATMEKGQEMPFPDKSFSPHPEPSSEVGNIPKTNYQHWMGFFFLFPLFVVFLMFSFCFYWSANENTKAEIIKHFPPHISPSSAPKIHALSSLLRCCSGESFSSPILDSWESGAVVMITTDITAVGCSKALLDFLTQLKIVPIEHSKMCLSLEMNFGDQTILKQSRSAQMHLQHPGQNCREHFSNSIS